VWGWGAQLLYVAGVVLQHTRVLRALVADMYQVLDVTIVFLEE